MFSDMTDDICPHCNRSIHENPNLAGPPISDPFPWSEYGRHFTVDLNTGACKPFSTYLTDLSSWSIFAKPLPPRLFTDEEIDEILDPLYDHDIVWAEGDIMTPAQVNELIGGRFKPLPRPTDGELSQTMKPIFGKSENFKLVTHEQATEVFDQMVIGRTSTLAQVYLDAWDRIHGFNDGT